MSVEHPISAVLRSAGTLRLGGRHAADLRAQPTPARWRGPILYQSILKPWVLGLSAFGALVKTSAWGIGPSQRHLILTAGPESNDGVHVGTTPHPHGHAPAASGRYRASGHRFGSEGPAPASANGAWPALAAAIVVNDAPLGLPIA